MMLLEPTTVSSQNGILHTSLHLMAATHTVQRNSGLLVSSPSFELTTRTLNGTVPGPLLRLRPGDTLMVDFSNDLEEEVGGGGKSHHQHNQFSAPNESNLHFHGLHVSGELPSDDSTYIIGPGQSYRYITDLPVDHMPGTHFIHPHRHGSTAFQVAGGAVAAIIVDDDPETTVLPPEILQARDVVLILQELQHKQIQNIAKKSKDGLYSLQLLDDGDGDSTNTLDVTRTKFYLANGQINPTIPIQPKEWIRLRIIHAGWDSGLLDIQIPGCEMQLIAKDGVYLPILPRKIDQAELVNAGRADIMVQCNFDDDGQQQSYPIVGSTGDGRPVATIIVEDDTLSSEEELHLITTTMQQSIPTTRMEFPAYLRDLRNTPPSPGCSCETRVGKLSYPKKADVPNPFTIEEQEDAFFHQSYQGAIVERRLFAGKHPYHQHVHPFQIISGGDTNYYQNGDWHDTIEGRRVVRYSPTVFTGKMMIHCHRLKHEDEGMMAMEYIHPAGPDTSTNATCVCGKPPPLLPVWAIVLICCGGVLLLMVAGIGLRYWMRRRRETNNDDDVDDDAAAAANKDASEKPPEISSEEDEPVLHVQNIYKGIDSADQQSFEVEPDKA